MSSRPGIIVCPSCRGRLEWSTTAATCVAEHIEFEIRDGIPDMVLEHRRTSVDAFLERYLAVRHEERWTVGDRAVLLALPYRDLTGRRQAMWEIRARGLDALRRRLRRMYGDRRLVVCERGAGVAWLGYRLALDGHTVIATDVNVDPHDGLAGSACYCELAPALARLRAEMDRLPLPDASIDVVVNAASLHYAVGVDAQRDAIREAARVLVPGGVAVVLDSPVYETAQDGEAMLADWRASHPAASGCVDSGYLVRGEVERLLRDAGLDAEFATHGMGLRWTANYLWQRLFGPRRPARMPMILGRKPPASSG